MGHALEHEEAQHPATSAQRLVELSANPRLRPLVAGNPAAPANLLEGLAEDQDSQVRQIVANNPNTPWSVLERLAWEFPHAFLTNPVGSLQVLARPEQISTDSLFWDALLRVAELPLLWWNWLNSHPVLHAHPALRCHVRIAGETLHFAGDPLEAEDLLLRLVELLMMASDQHVPLPVLRLPDQPVIAGEQIIVEHLRRLAQSKTGEVRRCVAGHPGTPEDVLHLLARDPNEEVRAAVARNPHMHEEALRSLAHDQSARVRAALAWNPCTPEDVLHLLARNPDAKVRSEVPLHPHTPEQVLRTLAHDPDWGVRSSVPLHPRAPEQVLRSLAHDPDNIVLEHVAQNPQTPADILRSLVDKPRDDCDEYEEVRVQVALNPGASTDILLLLADDENPRVRAFLSMRPGVPEVVLRLLAHDQEAWVRAAAVGNEQTPEEILHILAHDQAPQVRASVVWNRRTPEVVLRLLAHDQEEAVRAAVAANPRTPEEVLLLLAHDPVGRVRQRAQFVLRLLDAVKEPGYREHMSIVLSQAFHPDRIVETTINEQVGRLAEEVLPGRLGRLELTEHIRQTLIAALAAGWDAHMVRTARPQSAFSQGDLRRQMMAAFMPPLALQKLALSPSWEIRYLVALHEHTPQETRQQLCQDGNRYVRAMAQATTIENQCTPLTNTGAERWSTS